MKLFAVITDNEDRAPGITIFQDQAKAKTNYDETELDHYTKCKYLTSIEEGVDFGWSISSGGDDPFYGADVIEKEESAEEESKNESVKTLKYVKLFEDFNEEKKFAIDDIVGNTVQGFNFKVIGDVDAEYIEVLDMTTNKKRSIFRDSLRLRKDGQYQP
jgi:hypothetical protein